jgi:phage/plasmid-like protein (TIGR03299 family)
MAHELTQRKDGTVEMAFTGPRSAIWHGLGNNLEENASIEDWITSAGMDWSVEESNVMYEAKADIFTYPDRKILYRSDNKESLSIVGSDFAIVQPKEVVEFFRDLTQIHGMKLSTAGTLYGGKRFWALAETGREGDVAFGDTVKGHLLLVTAVDGSMATTAKFVSTRVVCQNTLTVALNGISSKPMVKVTHKKKFDPSAVKIDLGIIDQAWDRFMKNVKKMAETPFSDKQMRDFYQDLLYDDNKLSDEQSWGVVREVDRLMHNAKYGSGAELSAGTAWGALNGATELYTHGTGKRDKSHQFWDSYNGVLEAKKLDVYRQLALA